ncbi:CLUMA_CG004046, isoform A [Clunio marinus]|uniref:CLUMA_CG004046, isoform A n=1 Tax=Clunio marinus TaxID=568069 RepID=A0A1J1HQL2_9DIPT|nr:CLUMA_CG004046, isoform A [Clunio marinus]
MLRGRGTSLLEITTCNKKKFNFKLVYSERVEKSFRVRLMCGSRGTYPNDDNVKMLLECFTKNENDANSMINSQNIEDSDPLHDITRTIAIAFEKDKKILFIEHRAEMQTI